MPNGSIDYSLGLETTGILGKLTGVNQAFDLLGKVIDGVGTIGRSVFQEIERGAALKDLSNRTGETVGNLFQLQFAFEQSGIAAGSVPGTLLRFQKSLSGVGEMGENTAEAFAALKLNIAGLRDLDSPTALAKVFQGLNGLDRNSAADVAARIFGRGSSGDILQLARDSDGFAQSLADAARQAALFERNADAFDKFGDTIGQIKLELRGVFSALASDITPALQGMLSALASRNFETLGKIAELSLTVAFENSVNFLANALTKLFAAMPHLMEAAQGAGEAAIGSPLAQAWAQLNAGAAADMAAETTSARVKADMEAQAEYWAAVADATTEVAPDMARKAGEAFATAIKEALKADGPDLFGSDNANALAELLKPFAAAGGIARGAGGGGLGGTNLFSSSKASAGGDANALERIGLGLGGGGSSSLNQHARDTAKYCRESAQWLHRITEHMERRGRDSGFAHA